MEKSRICWICFGNANLWLLDYAHSAVLFYVNRPRVNYGWICWIDKDEKVHYQPDIGIRSSVQADSSCSACLTTGQSERPFSAWTRACTSQRWIAGQLHLAYARVCVSAWAWAGVHMSGVFVPPSTLPISSVNAKELTWQPNTPTRM